MPRERTSDPAVAPGSIVSIVELIWPISKRQFPANPLSQTVGGVTVRIGGTCCLCCLYHRNRSTPNYHRIWRMGPNQVYVKIGLQQGFRQA